MTGKTYVTTDATAPAATNMEQPTNGNNVDCFPIDIEQQTVPSTQMIPRRNSDDITLAPWLQRLGMDFPLFTDNMMKQYRKHNVENFNPFVFIPTILALYGMPILRNGLAGFYTYGGKVLKYRPP